MRIFEILFYEPIYNLLIVFYRLFDGNLGLAIIAIALLSRILLYPLTKRQIKMAETSREFNEKSKKLKKKYKNDKEKQQQELLKLQQEYLPAQLSGCLPLIFQIILFLNIYSVIRNIVTEGAAGFNSVAYSFVPQFSEAYSLNTDFFGLDLSLAANELELTALSTIPYLALAILVGISQYASMRILTGIRKAKQEKEGKKKPEKKKKDKKKGEPEDFSEIVEQSTKQAMLLMPALIVFAAYNLPAGMSLYWTVQSSFVIIQQLIMHRFGNTDKAEKK